MLCSFPQEVSRDWGWVLLYLWILRPWLGIRKPPFMGFSVPFPAFLQCSPQQCFRQTHQHIAAQTPFHVPSCIFFRVKCPPLSPTPTYAAHKAWFQLLLASVPQKRWSWRCVLGGPHCKPSTSEGWSWPWEAEAIAGLGWTSKWRPEIQNKAKLWHRIRGSKRLPWQLRW